MNFKEFFKVAYKKLKSNVYYDKTLVKLRADIVEFENNIVGAGNVNDKKSDNEKIDTALLELAERFCDPDKRGQLINDILDEVKCIVFPKKYSYEDIVNGNKSSKKTPIISNKPNQKPKVEECQYFIDLKVEGHILGILWILFIGSFIDRKFSYHLYGNRIKNNDDKLYDFSPNLFEPYYFKFSSWRDSALDQAQKLLKENNDVLILTMDFTRFFYSLDIRTELFDGIWEEVKEQSYDNVELDGKEILLKSLNDFVYQVIKRYSDEFNRLQTSITEKDKLNGKCNQKLKNILPIGFFPSNILSNYSLRKFDKAILDGWNPSFYGRYVDDILIVEKIQQGHTLYEITNRNLDFNNVIKFFLMQSSKWDGIQRASKNTVLQKKGKKYVLNKKYNPTDSDDSELIFNQEKMNLFYFKSGEADNLIRCFREKISKNKSEFRFLPEDEYIFDKDNYGDIFVLHNEESLNKFRGVKSIELDRYELSKFLGKSMRLSCFLDDQSVKGMISSKIATIFRTDILLENYTEWEKLFELLVVNESWQLLEQISNKILDAICSLTYDASTTILDLIRASLAFNFVHSLYRVLALSWGTSTSNFMQGIETKVMAKISKAGITFDAKIREAYIRSRMIDKNAVPVSIDMIDTNKIITANCTVNFTKFYHLFKFCKAKFENNYSYYPYFVSMHDISIISFIEMLKNNDFDLKKMHDKQYEWFLDCNFNFSKTLNSCNDAKNNTKERIVNVSPCEEDFSIFKIDNKGPFRVYKIGVSNAPLDKLRIALANYKLSERNIINVLQGRSNVSLKRYVDLARVVNMAVSEKADILILPELCIPLDWLPFLARFSAKNNIAIIMGIEFLINKHNKEENEDPNQNKHNKEENEVPNQNKIDNVYNFSAVILPYEEKNAKNAYITFHLKRYYSPKEKLFINGYSLTEVEGKNYELYRWHNSYFSLYCCYELTSIVERSLFHSMVDFLVAIEWNKDIHYFSNIIESLSRDLHCYCIQVNSSDYGDSRIVKPARTEEKDIIQTKGGENSTVLIGEIDIKLLRDFQMKQGALQAQDKSFKTTPPGFDRMFVKKRQNGTL